MTTRPAFCRLALGGFLTLTCVLGLSPFAAHARATDVKLPAQTHPGPERISLDIPVGIWDVVRHEVGAENRLIGYTATEMGNYGRSTLLLPTVLRLFEDARNIPRFSGKITDELIEDAGKVAEFGSGWSDGGLGEMARRCYRLLAVSTGRRVMPDTLNVSRTPFGVPASAEADWRSLPASIRELIARLYGAAEEVRPWLLAAFDTDLLLEIGGADALETIRVEDLYRVAMTHRDDERFGQLATLDRNGFRLLDTVDLAYLGYATILWLRHVEYALQAYQTARETESPADEAIASFRFRTPLGDVLVGGLTDDEHRDAAFLVVDLGGDDDYGPGFGASSSLASPIALVIDLDGDDRYVDSAARDTSVTGRPSFGAGVFGIGALIDLAGDDEYAVAESGLGRGCFGSGLLIDFDGNDSYLGGGRWVQGAAHAGIGVLLDLAGDDHYSCAYQSQGLGATKGTGLLLDVSGDDEYVARDDGNISELYLGQSVAMSQGCGYGRRADLGDGHSLAGGFGLLIDGDGHDTYHAQVWAQGCAYWWGVGILEDRAGNDRYRNGKYSSGAAAHFGIGFHLDLSGDDEFNLGNDTAKNQFQGHARDGSIGVFIDGDGDDRYAFRSHCAGSGDLGSIGLFWDRRGNDGYLYDAEPLGDGEWAKTPPLGSTTQYEPFRSFRDDLPTYGIFLDTAGEDCYDTGGIGWNGRSWSMRRNANAWGLGIDADVYTESDE